MIVGIDIGVNVLLTLRIALFRTGTSAASGFK